MCAIAGIINTDSSIAEPQLRDLESMKEKMKHRGPDGEGSFVYKNVALGHRRLSIVDVADGVQPMIDRTTSLFAITYNGELFNYPEIKEELESLGCIFRTRSDTEVVLKAYETWGEACLERFDAEFAFAIYDEAKQELFAARDRTGVKPFYYHLNDQGVFFFASEPKAITACSNVKKEMDLETVADFFLGNYIFAAGTPALDRSFFKGIYALPPGHYLKLCRGKLKKVQYWDLPISDTAGIETSFESSRVALRSAVDRSVYARIPREVKMGTALSGGLDSSIISIQAAKLFSEVLTSSCVSFISGQSNEDYEHAKIVMHAANIDLRTPALTAESMMQLIDPMIQAMDEPHDSIRQLGMFANYQTLRDAGCKVVLTGEGADEFNFGYWYRFPGLKQDQICTNTAATFHQMWEKRWSYVKNHFTPYALENTDIKCVIDKNINEYYTKCPSHDPIKKMVYFYGKKFLSFLEHANDRCSMANSVESRFPFLAEEVIRVGLSIDKELHLKNGTEKAVLREAYKGILPQEIYSRRKAPFPASEEMRLHKLIADAFQTNIKEADSSIWKVLNRTRMDELVQEFRARIEDLEYEYGPNYGGEHLTRWLPISEDVHIRTSHIFALLTFLRWYKLNGFSE